MDADDFFFGNGGKSKGIGFAQFLLCHKGNHALKVLLGLYVVGIHVLKALDVKGISACLDAADLALYLFKLNFCHFHITVSSAF